MSEARFTAVGVVIPANDEEDGIEGCLRGVVAALLAVPAPVAAAVCVVLDRCTDRTAALAAAVAAQVPVPVDLVPLGVVAGGPRRTVGELRNVGMSRVLARLGAHPPAGTWLLSTDADTTVTSTWVTGHLRHARNGAHAVAGLADLDDAHVLAPPVEHAYGRLLAAGQHQGGHDHVYGANLGVRADAYLAVGGFPAVPHGEDHALAGAVRAAGYRLVTATDVRVRTSSRLRGRAPGGLADLLADLTADRGEIGAAG